MESSTAVQYLTISEIVASLGEQQQAEGLHVFLKSEKKKVPIQYPFRTEHFSVLLVTDGEARIRLNLSDYTIHKNSLFVIPPAAIRQFLEINEHCSVIGLGFTPAFMGEAGIHRNHFDIFDFFSSQANPHLMLDQEDADILINTLVLLRQKHASQTPHSFNKEVVQHIFVAFMYDLAALYKKYNAITKIKLTRKEDLAMRFMKLLPQHFTEERSVQYYADLLYVTPKYLTKIVKETTSKTAGELIDEMVIIEARVMLNDLSMSVAQIADKLHFSDQFFFSKFFKKHTGFTPTDYRSRV